LINIKEVSFTGPSELTCPKGPQRTSPCKNEAVSPEFKSTIHHSASLLHPCLRVPKWNVDPEC
jgi:hypothetical protein